MKNPYHYQVTISDCVPTCFINALIHLFQREDIPPAVVQRIHTACYDCVGKNNELGRGGSSDWAAALLGDFIKSYQTDKFHVRRKYLQGAQVHLGPKNEIDACLNKGGVVLCDIRLFKAIHYVMILEADEEWVFIHDPYRRIRQLTTYDGAVTLMKSDGFGPNYRISREWLDQPKPLGRFCFGPLKHREAMAIWKVIS